MAAYLARRLDRAGIRYEKRDNCFLRIDFHTFVIQSYSPVGIS
jgi:hypothetical protein